MSLIHSEKEIREFACRLYLAHPNQCREHGLFIIMPWARKKYWDGYTGSNRGATRHLDRKFVSMRSDRITGVDSFATCYYRSILLCDAPEGAYTIVPDDKNKNEEEIIIPKRTMAIYGSIQPHDGMAAMKQLVHDYIDYQYSHSPDVKFVPLSRLQRSIHISPCRNRTKIMDLDVDSKEPRHLNMLVEFLKRMDLVSEILFVIETRGGFHVLIQKCNMGKNFPALENFFKRNDIKDWCSIASKDNVVPIPGTVQGGFNVTMWDLEKFLIKYSHTS